MVCISGWRWIDVDGNEEVKMMNGWMWNSLRRWIDQWLDVNRYKWIRRLATLVGRVEIRVDG